MKGHCADCANQLIEGNYSLKYDSTRRNSGMALLWLERGADVWVSPDKIFPSGTSDLKLNIGVVQLDLALDEMTEHLFKKERAGLANAVAKRRREIIAARLLAHDLLADIIARPQPLLWSSDRAPIWPGNSTGSITHCDDLCAVVVTKTGDNIAVGIDIEPKLQIEESLWAMIGSVDEIAQLPKIPDTRMGVWVRMLFVAKEAFYKAQYQLSAKVLDFRDISVQFFPHEGTFSVADAKEEGVTKLRGVGRFNISQDHLCAVWVIRGPRNSNSCI